MGEGVTVTLTPIAGDLRLSAQAQKPIALTLVATPTLDITVFEGLRGETGPPGRKGDPGEVGDLSLIVEMLPSASPPSVVKTGTPDAPVFTLGIPRSDIQTFMQTLDTSATEWTVSHMLGRIPNVQVTDSAGNVIYVNITHTDANTAVLSYNAAFVGKATFS